MRLLHDIAGFNVSRKSFGNDTGHSKRTSPKNVGTTPPIAHTRYHAIACRTDVLKTCRCIYHHPLSLHTLRTGYANFCLHILAHMYAHRSRITLPTNNNKKSAFLRVRPIPLATSSTRRRRRRAALWSGCTTRRERRDAFHPVSSVSHTCMLTLVCTYSCTLTHPMMYLTHSYVLIMAVGFTAMCSIHFRRMVFFIVGDDYRMFDAHLLRGSGWCLGCMQECSARGRLL